MTEELQHIHYRNGIMNRLLWLFLIIDAVINSFFEIQVVLYSAPFGIVLLMIFSHFIRKKIFIKFTMYFSSVIFFTFLIFIQTYEPLLINVMFIFVGLALSLFYQDMKNIIFTCLISMICMSYFFFIYREEVFSQTINIDIIYLNLTLIFIAIILLMNTKTVKHFMQQSNDNAKKYAESNERYESLIHMSPDPLLIIKDKSIIYCNKRAIELLGIKEFDELKDKSILDFIDEQDHSLVEDFIKKTFERNEQVTYFNQDIVSNEGEKIALEISAIPILFKGEKVIQAICRDVTERKNMEIELKNAKEKFQVVFEKAGIGIALRDANLRTLDTNPMITKMFGYTKDEFQTFSSMNIVHPEDVSKEIGLFEELVAGKRASYHMEKRYFHKEGHMVWGNLTVTMFPGNESNPTFIIGFIEDITKQKQYQMELQEKRIQLKNVFENLEEVFFSLDIKDDRLIQTSEACEKLFGYSADDFYADHSIWKDLIHPDDKLLVEEQIQHLYLGKKLNYQYRIIDKFGNVKWVHERGIPVFDEDGELIRVDGVFTDITDKKKTELLIKRNEQLLQGVAEATKTLITGKNHDIAINQTLHILGDKSNVDRVYVFKHLHDPKTNELTLSYSYEWVAHGIEPFLTDPLLQNTSYQDLQITDWYEEFKKGDLVQGKTYEFPKAVRYVLEAQKIQSIILVPIFIDSYLWGFIGFDNCREAHSWDQNEVSILKMLASIIGGVLKRAQTEEALKIARDNAVKATKAKSEFLSTMSHEIRTPMNAIIGMADLLGETELSDEQFKYVNIFKKSGESLLRIINSVLDLSKIEAGEIKLQNESFHLPEMLDSTSEVFASSADKKGLAFTIDVSKDLPLYVRGDADRLRQILGNLIGNAIKFTDQGSVTVAVRPYKGDKNGNLLFEISDTGVGIPKDKLKKIFNEFIQVDTSTTNRFGGTGLGLTIARKLIDMMNGEIWVESQVDKGSIFSFTISVTESEQSENNFKDSFQKLKNATEMKKSDHPIRILLVEDTIENQVLIHAYLKKMEWELDNAENGQEALRKFKINQYDLVLMDMQMPIMDGYTATKEIRVWEQSNGLEPTPIISLTAYALNEDRIKSLEAGCDFHLTKPIKKNILIETIEKFIQK